MNTLGMFIAIVASACMAIGIADYYDQPYNGYLFLIMMLTGFFIHIIILIVKSEMEEENEV